MSVGGTAPDVEPRPSPASEHAGRTVLITGAADGIGAALARRFVSLGATVALGDRDGPALADLVEQLRAAGGAVVAVTGDVTSTADNEALVAAAVDATGCLDVVIPAAGGYTRARPAEDVDDDEWERLLALNLTGVFRTVRAAIPTMKAAGRGRIVVFSSTAGRMPTPVGRGTAPYSAAKAGLLGLMRQLAVELGPHGITVNAVAPGTTLTPRVDALRSAEEVERIAAQIPLRRVATVEDQLGPVLFLASDAAAYVTGATLDVNGGRLML